MTTAFSTASYTGTITYPDALFMYSPLPLVVEANTPDGCEIVVFVSGPAASYTETRQSRSGKVRFDLAPILQHVMPDVDSIFSRTDIDDETLTLAAYDDVLLMIYVNWQIANTFPCAVQYGALDQLDSVNYLPARIRTWLNYPQTFRVDSINDEDDFYMNVVELPDGSTIEEDRESHIELELLPLLRAEAAGGNTSAAAVIAALEAGLPQTLRLSSDVVMTDAGVDLSSTKMHAVTLVPDAAPANEGTYLRWLGRDAKFCYWRFINGDLSHVIDQDNSATRFIETDPRVPVGNQLLNEGIADFTLSRALALGTRVDTLEEFSFITGLLVSPVVDRLVTLTDGSHLWQRVNIVPGSHTRSLKRGTPQGQLVEFSIQLPKSNTIKI